MQLTPRTKLSCNAFFIFVLLTLVLIAALPNGTVAQQENNWELKIPKTNLGDIYGALGVGDQIFLFQFGFSCYDPSTGDRTEKAPLRIQYEWEGKGDNCVSTAVALQNEIYVIGGIHKDRQNKDFTFIKIYNVSDDSWRNDSSTDYKIDYFPLANVVDGKIYLLDGRSGRLGVFDPSSDSWTTKTPLPIWYLSTEAQDTRIDQTVVINDRIYCFTSPNYNSPPCMIIYDTKTDNWLSGTNPPVTNSQASHLTFACATTGRFAPQRIYYIGAESEYPTTPAFSYVYDPVNDSWSIAESLSTSTLGYYVSTSLNDKIYYFAGNGSGVEVYTPIGYSTTPLSPSPSPIYPQNSPLPKTNPVVYPQVAVGVLIAASILLISVYLRKSKAKKEAIKQTLNCLILVLTKKVENLSKKRVLIN